MLTKNKTALPGLKEKRHQQKRDIIRDLYEQGELSKPEICRLTNMTIPTISKIIEELIEEGWVVDKGYGTSIGGKPPHIFALNPDAAYILGVAVGRKELKMAIFNLHKEIIQDIQVFPSLLESSENNEFIITDIIQKIEHGIKNLDIPKSKIKVAGFALPGLVDNEGHSFTFLSFEESCTQQLLQEHLQIPVFVDNDSTVMAMAEHTFGSAQGANDALCINVNECIGMGMILNGKAYTGHKGMAGEFGHIRISGPEHLCYCGKAGCLETVASGRAIAKIAKEAILEGKATILENKDIVLSDIIWAAKRDDIFAIDLLQKAGEKLGEALSCLIHLFNPELIVIGGEITKDNDIIISSIKQSVDKYTLTRLKNQCQIKISSLKNNASILGTLSLVMNHLHDETENRFSLY